MRALAAVAATATVSAQSVEIYGIVDLGYHAEKVKDNTGTLAKRTGLNSVVNGSRIGFRGTEDLGGGLKAGFVLEYAIQPDQDETSMANRQSFLSLNGGFGDVKLGRQYTLHFNNQAAGDMLGNLNAVAGYIGNIDGTTRINNAVTYTSPSFSGVTVAAQRGFGENTRAPGEQEDNNQQAIRIAYSAGPLAAGFATETIKNITAQNIGVFLGQTAQVTFAASAKKEAKNLFASYDLGVAKVALLNQNTKYSAPGETDLKFSGNTVSASIPFGAVTAQVSTGSGKFKVAGNEDTKVSGFQAGARYALSKRTFAYAYTGKTEFKDSTGKLKFNTTSVGIRHAF